MKRFIALISICALLLQAGPALCQILLEENFNDGTADDFTPAHPGWFVTPEGEYSIDNYGYEVFAWSYAGDTSWADYTVCYDLKSIDSVNQLVAFRVKSPGNCYVLNMRSTPWNDIGLMRWVDGVQVEEVCLHEFANRNDQWHHFDIRAVGPEISVYVDNNFVFTYLDESADPYLCGGIAAVSYSGGVVQHQILYLDDVLVRSGGTATDESTWSSLKAMYR